MSALLLRGLSVLAAAMVRGCSEGVRSFSHLTQPDVGRCALVSHQPFCQPSQPTTTYLDVRARDNPPHPFPTSTMRVSHHRCSPPRPCARLVNAGWFYGEAKKNSQIKKCGSVITVPLCPLPRLCTACSADSSCLPHFVANRLPDIRGSPMPPPSPGAPGTDVIWSFIGFLAYSAGIITWAIVYQVGSDLLF